MAVSRISVHVFDAESRQPLPDLYTCVQFLHLTDLDACLGNAGPTRIRVEPQGTRYLPGFLEFHVDVEKPYIGEVRLYDPPREVWPVQEWALIRPGGEAHFWIAVYPDGTSWPGNGRERLREALLEYVAPMGTYAALKGRFIAPEGAPFYEFFDVRCHLERKGGPSESRFLRLYDPSVLPADMAESWCEVPVPPGVWTFAVEGTRIQPWSQRLELLPGRTMDLGDVILGERISR